MAKKKVKTSRPSNPDQEKALLDARERAIRNSCPLPSPTEVKNYPQLLWLISPSYVGDPKHNGDGEARLVLREPLFMLSWDRGAGRWKWAVSDKTWGISTGGLVESLDDLLLQIEQQIVRGEVSIKELDAT
jgi:hypothetical protein